MTLSTIEIRTQEKGFTLVELAVVMIIIGLLIGGILKGQELIANAQVTNAISQIKGLDGAVSTFREAYNAFPGDMGNARDRIPSCDDNCQNSTSANGRLDEGVGFAPADASSEGVQFFQHLRAADLITNVDGTGNAVAFGTLLPSAPIGGGYFAGHTNANGGGPAGISGSVNDNGQMRSGHYITLNGLSDTDAGDPGAGGLSPNAAARIDRKLDDGLPEAGSVHATGPDCKTGGAPEQYNENVPNPLCSIAVRIQG